MTEVTKMERQEVAQNHTPDPMVSMIERVAMSPDADIGKLEKMLDMKERLEARDARRAFDLAIAEAKAEIPPILKTGEVDYVNTKGQRTQFKHETLDGIAKIVDPILSAHGLSYRFRSEQAEGRLHVTCIVAHRDGHFEETTLQGAPDQSGSKNAYQAVGSAATYLQRYTLKLALGLSAAKDDDGSSASKDTAETVTEDQYRTLRDLIDATGTDEAKFHLAYGHSDPENADLHFFPARLFEKAKAQLERKKAQMGAEGQG